MSETKRATIYLEPQVHKILKLKSIETEQSISELVNTALLHELAEDQEDLAAFEERRHEPAISYEAMLKELKRHGKI